MNLKELSKEISYALRHAPWEYELELDEEGFVPIGQLLHALNEGGTYVDVNRRVKDIGNLAVISAEKAASIIRNARKVMNKRLGKALKEAQGYI